MSLMKLTLPTANLLWTQITRLATVMTDKPSKWLLGRRTVTTKMRNQHLKQKSFSLNIKSTRVAKLMSVFSPRKSKNNHSDTPPSCTHNSSVLMDPNNTSQVLMDVDDPPVSLLQSLNHADLHPESNTVEMEAAWTNCGRQPQVKDVSDDDSNSDSDSSELVDVPDSDINLFSDDEDDEDEDKRAHQHNFSNLGLRFQLRAAQTGMI